MRTRLKPKRPGPSVARYLLYIFGRTLQVAGLVAGAVAATAFFGTSSTVAMLRMTLAAVLLFLPGLVIVRTIPPEEGSTGSSRSPGRRRGSSG
jgi:hypothetical protein